MFRFTDVISNLILDIGKYQFTESTLRSGISLIFIDYQRRIWGFSKKGAGALC